MGNIEFGYGESREYLPKHNDIDWHQVYLRNHDEVDNWPIWAECYDEFGEYKEQMHQENCFFYINKTDPSFDAIIVKDHRDEGADWWFSRGQIGSDEFDDLLEKIGDEVVVIRSKYPVEHIGHFILKLMESDIDEIT